MSLPKEKLFMSAKTDASRAMPLDLSMDYKVRDIGQADLGYKEMQLYEK